MNARRRSAGWIAAAFVGLGAVHLLVGRATHAQHAVHAVFGAAYLLPIVAAAAWLGPRAGVLVALASAAVNLVHASGTWADPSMPGVGGLVQAGVYVFVGAASAALVGAADRERRARVELGDRRARPEPPRVPRRQRLPQAAPGPRAPSPRRLVARRGRVRGALGAAAVQAGAAPDGGPLAHARARGQARPRGARGAGAVRPSGAIRPGRGLGGGRDP